mmetsp:Transcript_12879/g.33214  ORF Transcript_12879/g.33214 Transcript_12879/m.33214 type:complete len:248 (+) Transcript_12879:553-1296(+)
MKAGVPAMMPGLRLVDSPKSHTLARRLRSTRTLDALMSLCTMGGLAMCRNLRPLATSVSSDSRIWGSSTKVSLRSRSRSEPFSMHSITSSGSSPMTAPITVTMLGWRRCTTRRISSSNALMRSSRWVEALRLYASMSALCRAGVPLTPLPDLRLGPRPDASDLRRRSLPPYCGRGEVLPGLVFGASPRSSESAESAATSGERSSAEFRLSGVLRRASSFHCPIHVPAGSALFRRSGTVEESSPLVRF